MVSSRKPARTARRGVSAVECALVLPVVLMFVFGIMEYGRYIMMQQVLTNAAREGARYAVEHTEPVTLDGQTYGNATSDVTNKVNNFLAGQALIGQTVSIDLSNSTGSATGTWTNAQPGQLIRVRITGTYRPIVSQILPFPTSINVTAQAVMRSESH